MGVDFLLILFLQTEEHLDGCVSTLDIGDALFEFNRHLGSVLVRLLDQPLNLE